MLTLPAERLHDVATTILRAAGTPDDIADQVADLLAESDLGGHESHGIQLLPRYIGRIRRGKMLPAARPSIVEETATTALVSGGWGYGQVSGLYATEIAVKKARESKVAVVAMVECGHVGRLGAYSERAVREGIMMIGTLGGDITRAGGGRTVPHGGRVGSLGTNPWAFGVPAGDQPPVSLDFSSTMLAGNKVRMAEARGEPLPPGAILDKEGRPSTDPKDLREGGVMLPIAGHKGYGLALCAELLGNVISPIYRFPGIGRKSGVLFIALDPTMFAPAEAYRAAADAVIGRIKSVPPAPGFEEVLIPGEGSARRRASNRAEGVALADKTWDALADLAQSLGADVGPHP